MTIRVVWLILFHDDDAIHMDFLMWAVQVAFVMTHSLLMSSDSFKLSMD